MNKFAAGKTYNTRSIGDYNCIFSVTVASRTAKTIKTDDGKTLRIGVYDGMEFVRPLGNYSMAPMIRAEPDMNQPKIDSRDRAICEITHSSGIVLAVYVDDDGDYAGVSLPGSDVDLTTLFDDYSEFDAAIAAHFKHEAFADFDMAA